MITKVQQINIFLFVFVVYIIVNILFSLNFFLSSFPNNYTWTELCINYQGGFIRRGLVGELLLQSAKIFDIRCFICLSFFLLYSIYVILFISLLRKSIDSFSCLLIIVCPSLLFFFAFDKEILFRKDVIYETGFIIQFIILISKKISFKWSFFFVLSIYIICLLVHESTIFYSAPCFTLLLEKSYRCKKFIPSLFVVSLIIFITVVYLLLFPGTTIQKQQILLSWQPTVQFQYIGALEFIGKSINFQLNQVANTISIKLFTSILFAIAITSLPLLKICAEYNIKSRFKVYFSFPFYKIALLLCFAVPWLLPIIANDFGRHIHTAFLNYICFISSIITLTSSHNKSNSNNRMIYYSHTKLLIWLFVFSFGWKLWHYNFKGQIITFSDPLRTFLTEIVGI